MGQTKMKPAQELKVLLALGELATTWRFKWFVGEWPCHDVVLGHAANNSWDLSHELAHFRVSPKRLRNKPSFGLGSPGDRSEDLRISSKKAYELELEASLLGIMLIGRCGAPFTEQCAIAEEHTWYHKEGDEPASVVDRLRKKKLWDKHDDDVLVRVLKRINR